jgi:DNA invertase Pin-like site-specific DNA recombinase
MIPSAAAFVSRFSDLNAGWTSTRDLLNTPAAITDKKAGFRSLGDTWADITTPHDRLMLTVLGDLAEFECDLIRGRTSEGERAKAHGVKLGRKPN